MTIQLSNPFEKETTSTPPSEFSSSLPSLEYKSTLNENKNYLKKYSTLNKKTNSKSILDESNDFVNLGDEIKDKLNKELAEEGNWEDVFFGKYRVTTPIIKIMTRDFAEPDGDRVQILLNNLILVQSILLDVGYKTNYIDLREGDNLLDILALNQGLAGPNTATFTIYDGNGNLLTTDNWNLKKGVSAKFIIEYVKEIDSK
ncbi:hypothetical protein [Flavobacterium sp. N1861]|uniref:hypothetical protein n=1 Tax=Flavobacterium sp. N1861 TaxID=2986825 RepID=UPI0022257B1B|nr:hypothetical protein [Flavobacterium sp. N1861]